MLSRRAFSVVTRRLLTLRMMSFGSTGTSGRARRARHDDDAVRIPQPGSRGGNTRVDFDADEAELGH